MLMNKMCLKSNGSAPQASYVNRGTTQGGLLAPPLWVVTRNVILLQLNGGGVKDLAYADVRDISFHKILQFHLPSHSDTTITQYPTAKYLGVEFNNKLN